MIETGDLVRVDGISGAVEVVEAFREGQRSLNIRNECGIICVVMLWIDGKQN